MPIINKTRLNKRPGTAHDEVILEVDRKDAAEIEVWAKRIMVEEMATLLPGVPVEVESRVCSNWGESKLFFIIKPGQRIAQSAYALACGLFPDPVGPIT